MAEKRKSAFKHSYRCRRNRSSTPAPDLLSPYLPAPELFISPPMSSIQTRPAYSTVKSDSSLSSASSFLIEYAPSLGPMVSFNSNLIPSTSGSFYTESQVVQDLSIRSTAQSVLPLQIDWYGPSRPSTLYMVPTQSNFMIPLVVILNLVSKDFFENLGCQTIHWTVSLEGFLMLFQVQPFLVVMSKQNFIMPSPG